MFSLFKHTSPTHSESPYLDHINHLLIECAAHYENDTNYIHFLCHLLLSRKKSTLHPTQEQLEAELNGPHDAIVKIAIVKKLETLLAKEAPPPFDTASIYDRTCLYLLNHAPQSLPNLILWVYHQSLKNGEGVLELNLDQIQFLSVKNLKRLHKIINLFNITHLKMLLLGDTHLHDQSLQWKALLSIMAGMQRIDLDFNHLNKLSDAHLMTLAKALFQTEILNISDNFKHNDENENKHKWENFVRILLENTKLTTFTIDDLSHPASLPQQLTHSNVSSLVLVKPIFQSRVTREENTALNKVIASNNRRAALALEHGGLKRLIAYLIWNDPTTNQIYTKHKTSLPVEVRDYVENLKTRGLFIC